MQIAYINPLIVLTIVLSFNSGNRHHFMDPSLDAAKTVHTLKLARNLLLLSLLCFSLGKIARGVPGVAPD